MELSGTPSELALLRSFAPFDGMKPENLAALARKIVRRQAPAGRLLFAEGDTEKQTYYLLSGTVDLLREGEVVGTVRSGTPKAKVPLAHTLPRPYSAVATSNQIEYLQVDGDFLDIAVTWDQTGSYHVAELKPAQENVASDDWMTALLETKAFHKVPPANIQAVFMRLQRRDHRAGDVIIKQGEQGDYFYIVVKGLCVVTRETPINKNGVKLAELRVGDTFGEEALVSDVRRNATVTMATDGAVMRLGKDDFRELLKKPFLQWIDWPQAVRAVAAGAQWLDVRLPSEFEQYRLDGAVNIPMYSLRLKMKALDRQAHYIVVCDTGRRSSACAYILAERGYQACVLRGGLQSTDIVR